MGRDPAGEQRPCSEQLVPVFLLPPTQPSLDPCGPSAMAIPALPASRPAPALIRLADTHRGRGSILCTPASWKLKPREGTPSK